MKLPDFQVMRIMLTIFVVIFILTLLSESNQHLSTEAKQYQEMAEAIAYSGFSPGLIIAGILWTVGGVIGTLGVVLLFFRKRIGLTFFITCFLLLAVSVPFVAPEEYYPFVKSYTSILLWCASSAAWNTVCVFTITKRKTIFT